jgi:hypothetical protein
MSNDTLTVTEVVNSVTVTPVNNTVTVSGVGVQGPAGATGATGATGPTGATGATGPTGTISLPIPSTYYITTPFQSYSNVNATLSRTNYIAIYVPATTTFDRIAVTTASTFNGTATVRMGVYANDTATGKPSTLILDAGTVSCTVLSTNYQITIDQTLTSGFYWIASNIQAAASTNTFIGNTATQGAYNPLMPYKTTLPSSNFITGWREENITSAFTTAGTLLTLGSTPLTYLRAV